MIRKSGFDSYKKTELVSQNQMLVIGGKTQQENNDHVTFQRMHYTQLLKLSQNIYVLYSS